MKQEIIQIYTIKTPADGGLDIQMKNSLKQLFSQIKNQRVIKLSVFIDAENNADFICKKQLLLNETAGLPYFVPISILSQKPLNNNGLNIEAFCIGKESGIEFYEKTADGFPYLLIGHKDYKKVIACGLQNDTEKTNILKNSEFAFSRMEQILQGEGMEFSDVVRQWNYIERIVDYDNGNQHYQIFNDIRTSYYSFADFNNGYPSATGIGINSGNVCIDFMAMKTNLPIIPVNSPVQTNAHMYNDKVLENNRLVEGLLKSSPKFERAKIVDFKDFALVFVSGTAAIKGQNTIKISVEEQTRITINNIKELIAPQNLTANNFSNKFEHAQIKGYRVYIKNEQDFDAVASVCNQNFKGVPILFLKSDICRPDLLVEIEALFLLY